MASLQLSPKLFLLAILFLSDISNGNIRQHNVSGTEILKGLEEIFLYIMTPSMSPISADPLSDYSLLQKKKQELTRKRLNAYKKQHLNSKLNDPTYNPDASDYFKFIPRFVTGLENGKTFSVDIPCYQDASATYSNSTNEVVFELHKPESLLCRAAVVVTTDKETFVKEFWTSGTHAVSFSMPNTDAEIWDLNRGPRLFVFPTDLETALGSLASTMLLFEPTLTQGVTWPFDEWNLNFLRDYAGIEMPKRVFDGSEDDTSFIPDPSLIKSGDTFQILRLDGLDPMIAWAMGSATGHTTVAMWKDTELFVCESNAKSGYWPINGIQCNKYHEWMEYGKKADYNTVWVPLSEENSELFDETKAWEYIEEHMGIDYGWQNVLTGWLDLNDGNKVCLDLDKTWCLEPEHHLELVFSVADRISEDASRLFKPAMFQRAGITNYSSPLVEAYYRADTQGMDITQLHNMVELDTYKYPTLKYNEPVTSDVSICHVFVCKVFKASGIFGDLTDEFNCGDLSVNDMYRLNIYDENRANERPSTCKERDPENPLCQVLGKYALRLDNQPGDGQRYNYVSPYPNFGSRCPSQAPEYLAPSDC